MAQGDTELELEGHELSDESPEPRVGTPRNSFTQEDMDNGGSNSRVDVEPTKEELIHEVFRVMERVGWPQRPPPLLIREYQRPGSLGHHLTPVIRHGSTQTGTKIVKIVAGGDTARRSVGVP